MLEQAIPSTLLRSCTVALGLALSFGCSDPSPTGSTSASNPPEASVSIAASASTATTRAAIPGSAPAPAPRSASPATASPEPPVAVASRSRNTPEAVAQESPDPTPAALPEPTPTASTAAPTHIAERAAERSGDLRHRTSKRRIQRAHRENPTEAVGEFVRYLRDTLGSVMDDQLESWGQTNGRLHGPPPGIGSDAVALPGQAFLTTTGTEPAAPEFSATNTQEAGVDEADRIEFDGRHLYVAPTDRPFYWIPSPIAIRPVLVDPIEIVLPPTGAIVTAVGVSRDSTAGSSTVVVGASIDSGTAVVGRDLGDLSIRLAQPATVASSDSVPEFQRVPEPEPLLVRVLDTDGDEPQAHQVASVELSTALAHVNGMYLRKSGSDESPDRLAVIGTNRQFGWWRWWGAGDMLTLWPLPWAWTSGRTVLDVHDVDEPDAPEREVTLELEGTLIASRRVGDVVFAVTRHTVSPWHIAAFADRDEIEKMRDELDVSDVEKHLPRLWIDGEEAGPLVEAKACRVASESQPKRDADGFVHWPFAPQPILTTITAIDLREPKRPKSVCLAGATSFVYASLDNIYVVNNDYAQKKTHLHKYALDGRGVRYRGTASVKGGVSDSFKLGERKGALGVLSTTLDANWSPVHHLTFFANRDPERPLAFEEIGGIPNEHRPEPIGKPRESLFGVRFVGKRLYAVTFRRIDPLYVIDIEDPTDPQILGELEVPGFSNYLHPVGEDLLVGVGQNDWLAGGGVKIELYDVSDADDPKSVESLTIGDRGSSSAVDATHLAFSFLAGRDGGPNRFAIPIQRWSADPPWGGVPFEYPRWSDTGLHLFEVTDANAGGPELAAVGEITADQALESDEYPRWAGSIASDRSVIVGDRVHYVHAPTGAEEAEVWSAYWDDPEGAVGPQ